MRGAHAVAAADGVGGGRPRDRQPGAAAYTRRRPRRGRGAPDATLPAMPRAPLSVPDPDRSASAAAARGRPPDARHGPGAPAVQSSAAEAPGPLLPPTSRRGFLVRSAALGALLAAGGAASGCWRGSAARSDALLPDDARAHVLPRRELAVLHAVAGRIVPGGADHPGARELRVAERIDRELTHHPGPLARDLRDALRVLEWGPLFSYAAPFTALEAAEQDASLRVAATSRLGFRRSSFQGVKFLVTFLHYSQEPAWAGIGYDGPWVPRGPDSAPRLGQVEGA